MLDIAAGVVLKVDLGNELDAINWLLERSGESALDSDTELDEPIGVALVGSEIYESLIAILGIEPKTAAALVTAAENSLFKSRRGLASCCRLAPADNRSGTSIRSTSPQHGGNKQLKNLLIFKCNALVGTEDRFGRLRVERRARMKVVYAIARDAGAVHEENPARPARGPDTHVPSRGHARAASERNQPAWFVGSILSMDDR